MIEVAILTEEQKDLLVGQEFMVDVYFNPIQDINNNWVILNDAIEHCIYEKFNWLKDLELIPYEPKKIELDEI